MLPPYIEPTKYNKSENDIILEIILSLKSQGYNNAQVIDSHTIIYNGRQYKEIYSTSYTLRGYWIEINNNINSLHKIFYSSG